MGCDIHMYVEFRGARWSKETGWKCGDYFSITDPTDPNCEPIREGLIEWRSYSLFAVLANVRNCYGEDAYPYISMPKGLPDDATEYTKREYESWGIDAHSCSYLTMREIVEFHENCPSKDVFGNDILKPLIDRLIQRADELNVIYDFEIEHPLKDDVLERLENIRIVFWFDN